MRLPDEQTYGPVSDTFHTALTDALEKTEEMPMKRKGFTIVLVMAILIVVLAATAVAVTQRLGLDDILSVDGWPRQEREGYIHEMKDAPMLQTTVGDLEIVVTEALGDGEDYFFLTTIALKPGAEGILVPYRHQAIEEVENPDGLPLYLIENEVLHENMGGQQNGAYSNEDGSLSYMCRLNINTVADTANMNSLTHVAKVEADETFSPAMMEATVVPFVIDTMEAEETRTIEAPIALDELDITIDGLYWKRTVNGVYFTLFIDYKGGEKVDYLLPGYDGVAFELVDDEGQSLSVYGIPTYPQLVYDTYYRITAQPEIRKLPDKMTLRLTEWRNGKVLAEIPITLAPGAYDHETLDKYYHVDYKPYDMLEGTGMMDANEWVGHLNAPQGETIALYKNADENSEKIGEYASGIGVQVWGKSGEWTSVFAITNGSGDESAVRGYARLDNVALGRDSSEVTPGIRVAVSKPRQGDDAQVRVKPDAASVISGRVQRDAQAYILGETDEWYHVLYVSDLFQVAMGYVPKADMAPTERTVILDLYRAIW